MLTKFSLHFLFVISEREQGIILITKTVRIMTKLTKIKFVSELKKLQGITIKSVARHVEYPISYVSNDVIKGKNSKGSLFEIKVDKLFDSYDKGTKTRKGLWEDKCVSRKCYLSPALAILNVLYNV